MSKFKSKGKSETPAVSTASLPDIVFMLLFFFMVVTKLRDSTLKVVTNTPSATELTKLDNKSLVNFIFIGKPTIQNQALYGTKARIQLGDKISETTDIPLFLETFKTTLQESQHPSIISSLKIDGEVTMGIVQDVKTALRKAAQLKVNYSAKKKSE